MECVKPLTNCPNCGYNDPFMRSWHDAEMEASEHLYFKEWDEELFHLLETDKYVWVIGVHSPSENHIYHMTIPHTFKRAGKIRQSAGSIYRWSIHVLMARKGARIQYDTKSSQRKNYHLKDDSQAQLAIA